ncbi:MAG: right-handed parallel beta-helix repeat-containing protein [Candidatus Sericytochromatia bacterium]|nr:right-handed parallel beta-helix repeat-containing protein [Candidatus Sericytochromatia bacterium]
MAMVEGWLVALFALLCPVAPESAPAAPGRVLEVPPDETIQSVLWKARPGDRLRLSGRHEERIFPAFDLVIEAGEDGSLVGRDGPALSVGPGITVRVGSVLLERRNTPGLPGGPVVMVRGGSLLLEGTRVVAATDDGLRVAGHGHVELDGASLQAARGTALKVTDNGVANLVNGRISGDGSHVVVVSERASLHAAGTIVTGRRTLLRGEDDGRITLSRLRLEGGERGVELAQRARVSCFETLLSDQRSVALELGDQSDMALADATVSPAVGMAVALNGDANLQSRRTTWAGQPARAGLLGGQARWLGHRDTWQGWSGEGFTVSDLAGLAHRQLRVRRLVGTALQLASHGRAVLMNADIEGVGEDGIVLVGDARLQWEGGRLAQVGRDAVVAGGKSRVLLGGVQFSTSGRHDLVGDDESSLTLRDLKLTGAREVALLARGRSRIEASRIAIEGHKGTGAAALGDSRMVLDTAEIRGGRLGVLYLDRAAGELRQCRIADHAADGVVVQDEACPRLQELEIRGQGQAGLRILDGARPVLERSVLVGNAIGLSVEAPGRPRGQPFLGMNRVVDNTVLDHEGLLPGPLLKE